MRVGVVGVGSLGRHHARILRGLPGVSWVGVHDLDPERAAAVSRETGAEVVASLAELAERVDAAVVATPTAVHAEVGGFLLENDVHVLVEKPIATDRNGAKALLELARSRGRVLAVGHVEAYNPAVLAVLAEGTVPRYLEVQRLGPFSGRGLDMDVVLDLMIHDLHLASSFGKSPVRDIRAVGVPVLTDRIDIVNARIEFAGGLIANLTASRVSLEKSRKMRLFSRDAYYSLDLASQQARRVHVEHAEGKQRVISQELAIQPVEPLRSELEAFLAACKGESSRIVAGDEALLALELALAVTDAARRTMIGFGMAPVPFV